MENKDSDSRIFPIRSLLSTKDSTTPSDTSKNSLESTSPPIKVSQDDLFVWSNGKFVHCDQEPIHIPGCIQSFGALIAITTDEWQVVLASENCFQIIQIDVFELLKSHSFKEFISEEQTGLLKTHFEGLDDYPDEAGPVVLSFEFKNTVKPFYCACHKTIKNPGMYILEFELQEDDLFPLNVTNDETSSSFPMELNVGQPNVTQNFDHMMGVFNMINRVNSHLTLKTELNELAQEVSKIVRNVTGFDRILVYQFDEEWNGEVIAEDRSSPHVDSFLGLRFPHTDIPKQARDLYVTNKIRLLYQRDLKPSRLLYRNRQDSLVPIDLSFSYLRAISPLHIKYLQNMGVQSSMSISIICFEKLWGLIACHNYLPKRVSLLTRKFCRMLGDTVSKYIEGVIYKKRLMSRQVITAKAAERIAMGKDLNDYIVAKAEDLLELFKSDLAVISIEDEAKVMGKSHDSTEVMTVLEYLRLNEYTELTHSDCVKEQWPDFPIKSTAIAGILHIPLSRGGKDFITFMRKEQVKHVNWAGNPYKSQDTLTPRSSFDKWVQLVSGRSKAWTDDEFEVAAVLQLVYWKFIDIWRQRDAAVQSNRLKNLLLANVSHEVRTPLNAIINYLEIALENPISDDLKQSLTQAHSASKSLIFIINDLLDLTRIEAGKMLFRSEPFNLLVIVREAAKMFIMDASRKDIEFAIFEDPNIPEIVVGDPSKIRQIVINLCCNALKFTKAGSVKLYCNMVERTETNVSIEIAVVDTGIGIPKDKLSVIFEDFEQVESSLSNVVQGTGLGLAIVARIVRNMGGVLRVDSEPQKGSKFTLSLRFPIYNSQELTKSTEKLLSESAGPIKMMKEETIKYNVMDRSPLSFIEGQQIVMKEPSLGSPRSKTIKIEDPAYPPTTEAKSLLTQLELELSPQTTPTPQVSETCSHQFNILYAEDDLVNQQIIEKRMKKMKHHVTVCHNGVECVELYKRNPNLYDAILMDIQMPLCDGLEATSLIRDFERDRALDDNLPLSHRLNKNRVPIFAVSASVYEYDRDACLHCGMSGYLNKPVDIRLLDILLKSTQDLSMRSRYTAKSVGDLWDGAWFPCL